MKKQQAMSGYSIINGTIHQYNNLSDILDKVQNLTWLHLNYKDQTNYHWIEDQSRIPAIVKLNLLEPDPRPRAQLIDQGILVVLKGLNFQKESRPEDMISIRMWITENLIITTSNRELHSISEIQAELEQGIPFQNSLDFVVKILSKLNYKISEFIDDLNEKTYSLDDDLMQSELNSLRFELATLRKQVAILKRYLIPQKDAVEFILTTKIHWLSDQSTSQLHEELDSLKKQLEDLNVIREQTAILNELLISNISETMGQRMYKLSIITLVFLPLTFFTGLFGANVGGIPFHQGWYGFAILSLMCFITVLVEIILFKKAKWL